MTKRLVALLVPLFALFLAVPAHAEVLLSFHSFNGSVLFGRYPHTFIVLEGTLEETGETVNENYGFSAESAGPAVLLGPVEHVVMVEESKYIADTNRHFTVPISDERYYEIVAEVARWRDAPGEYYDLDTRNCIHFVGKIAEMVGLQVNYPEDMLRRPKKWLNYITRLNPQLGAEQID